MEIRRQFHVMPAAALPRIRPASQVEGYQGDALALSSHGPETPPIGLSELDAAKQAFWPRYAGGAATAVGGLGVTSIGVLGAASLPWAAFAGLFVAGLAIAGAGLYLAFTAAKRVSDAQQSLNNEGGI